MRTFRIDKELERKRAIVNGPYAWLMDGTDVIVVDSAETEYYATVETRCNGGAVVRITGLV